jgi:hypothetical protein
MVSRSGEIQEGGMLHPFGERLQREACSSLKSVGAMGGVDLLQPLLAYSMARHCS